MTDRFSTPEGSLLRRELRAAREPARLAWSAPRLWSAPRGDEPVMLIPGYGTNDTVMAPLRGFLRGLGHRVWGWELGTNRGDVAGVLPHFMQRVIERHQQAGGKPLTLVGWSLGGVFAREATRDRPDLVSQVITMATPIYGGPRYTVSADNYTPEQLDDIEARIDARNRIDISRRITAFYSRNDGAVDWRTCIDDISTSADNIEVDSSHLGITLDPDVWLRIAQLLGDQAA